MAPINELKFKPIDNSNIETTGTTEDTNTVQSTDIQIPVGQTDVEKAKANVTNVIKSGELQASLAGNNQIKENDVLANLYARVDNLEYAQEDTGFMNFLKNTVSNFAAKFNNAEKAQQTAAPQTTEQVQDVQEAQPIQQTAAPEKQNINAGIKNLQLINNTLQPEKLKGHETDLSTLKMCTENLAMMTEFQNTEDINVPTQKEYETLLEKFNSKTPLSSNELLQLQFGQAQKLQQDLLIAQGKEFNLSTQEIQQAINYVSSHAQGIDDEAADFKALPESVQSYIKHTATECKQNATAIDKKDF